MSDVGILARLAVREWLFDWRTSLCLAIGVMAAAAPLLLLMSIRSGVLEQMRGELERYPSSRELVTVGEPLIDWSLVAALRKNPDVAFVAPLTRFLSASALLRADGREPVVELDLLPSGPGEPLLDGKWRRGSLALTAPAARSLELKVDDKLSLIVSRTAKGGVRQIEAIQFRLAAIIPTTVSGSSRRMALLDPHLLLATEIWRENPDAKSLSDALVLATAEEKTHRYAGLRIYARTIDGVAPLRATLAAKSIDTESRAADIYLVKRLDQGLTIVLAIIAGVVSTGLCLSLAVAQWGWVHRKRGDLSYLRLIGIDGNGLMLLPLLQAVLTTMLGIALAVAFAWTAHGFINALFVGQLAAVRDVSRMEWADISAVAALSLTAGGLAAILAAHRVRQITPAVALRGE